MLNPLSRSPEQLVIVTQSVANPEWAFAVGDVWKIPAGVKMPQALALNSEAYKAPAPHDVKVFDPVEFERVSTRKRVEPPTPRRLYVEDVLARFHWSRDQFDTACGSIGFPARDGTHMVPGSARSGGAFWVETRVEHWEAAVRSLNLGEK